jgi:hypothetical protein
MAAVGAQLARYSTTFWSDKKNCPSIPRHALPLPHFILFGNSVVTRRKDLLCR